MIKKIFLPFYTIYVCIYVISIFLIHYSLCRILNPFIKRKYPYFVHFSACTLLKSMFFMMAAPIKIIGKENIPTKTPFMIASNHLSVADIAVLMTKINHPLAFFAKEELRKVPLLGYNLVEMNHFLINRSNPRQVLLQMEDAKKKMQYRPIVIFPEGTRSTTGELLPFKKGAFHLAVQTGIPILPCYISGTHKLIPKKFLWMSPTALTLKIGHLIPVEQQEKAKEKESSQEVLEKVYNAISELKNNKNLS
jgi:1-acyl-sn-glycerol-3-phosphate acyltransferase